MAVNYDKKIVIVGGGFGGIRAALNLEKAKPAGAKIILISDKPHFEYTPALYRVVAGRSPLETCIPLREIFSGKNVEVIEDRIIAVDPDTKHLLGESGARYSFDYLLLALGSETAYYNIPGISELSFGIKSVSEALRLRRHLHEIFEACSGSRQDNVYERDKKVCATHAVIVGGGSTGVEVAGELAVYLKELAAKHRLNPALITIDLIEAAPRILSSMPESVSSRIAARLRKLGVNVFTNRMLVKEELETVYLRDMEIKTKTLIWTAGVRPNHLYSQIKGFSFDKNGRVEVDEFLQAKNMKDVFIMGDGAALPDAGTAQSAIRHAKYVSRAILRKLYGKRPEAAYHPQKSNYIIPVGPRWAAVVLGPLHLYGWIGWWMRNMVDLLFLFSIFSPGKALAIWIGGKAIAESCPICSQG